MRVKETPNLHETSLDALHGLRQGEAGLESCLVRRHVSSRRDRIEIDSLLGFIRLTKSGLGYQLALLPSLQQFTGPCPLAGKTAAFVLSFRTISPLAKKIAVTADKGSCTRSPSSAISALLPFLGGRFPTKIDYRKSW